MIMLAGKMRLDGVLDFEGPQGRIEFHEQLRFLELNQVCGAVFLALLHNFESGFPGIGQQREMAIKRVLNQGSLWIPIGGNGMDDKGQAEAHNQESRTEKKPEGLGNVHDKGSYYGMFLGASADT